MVLGDDGVVFFAEATHVGLLHGVLRLHHGPECGPALLVVVVVRRIKTTTELVDAHVLAPFHRGLHLGQGRRLVSFFGHQVTPRASHRHPSPAFRRRWFRISQRYRVGVRRLGRTFLFVLRQISHQRLLPVR